MLKFLLLSLFAMVMFCATYESVCAQEEFSEIERYRKAVAACVVGEYDALNVEVQIRRLYQEVDCLRDVYYKIADDFYGEKAETLKHNFDKYLQASYSINGDVYFPDFIKNENAGQVFVLKTKINVRDDVILMINRYLDGVAYWLDNFSLEELS